MSLFRVSFYRYTFFTDHICDADLKFAVKDSSITNDRRKIKRIPLKHTKITTQMLIWRNLSQIYTVDSLRFWNKTDLQFWMFAVLKLLPCMHRYRVLNIEQWTVWPDAHFTLAFERGRYYRTYSAKLFTLLARIHWGEWRLSKILVEISWISARNSV